MSVQGQQSDEKIEDQVASESTYMMEDGIVASANEDGSVDIVVPEDIDNPEVADAFISKLTPDQLKDFEKNFLNKKEEGSDKGATDGDPDPEVSASVAPSSDQEVEQQGLPAEIFAALEPAQQNYIKQLEEKVQIAGDYADKAAMDGLEKLLSDPVVSNRLKVLLGQEKDVVMEGLGQFMDPRSLHNLRLDFDMDPVGSSQRLSTHVAKLIDAARSSERAVFQQEHQRKEGARLYEAELQKVASSDKALASSLPVSDPKHPLAKFQTWLKENEKNVNLVGLGGPETYALYLHKTGQKTGLDSSVASRSRQETLKAIGKAKSQAATTLGRTAQPANASQTSSMGVDIKRFRTDDDYAQAMWQQHGGDPKMAKALMSMATE